MTGDLRFFLAMGTALFAFGAFGFLTRRNLLAMFLSAEVMALGVAVNFVAFGRHHHNQQGQAFALFVLAVAACESAIALTLVVSLWQRKRTLDVAACSALGEYVPPPTAAAAAPLEAEPEEFVAPHLQPAGPRPHAQEAARV